MKSGVQTRDIKSVDSVSTSEFIDAIIGNLSNGDEPALRKYERLELVPLSQKETDYLPGSRKKKGADIFIESNENPSIMAEQLSELIKGTPYRLKMISNRGTQVWPPTGATPTLVDCHRCRFVIEDYSSWHTDSILGLLERVGKKFRWMHVEKLENLDGEDVFTKAQGES